MQGQETGNDAKRIANEKESGESNRRRNEKIDC